MLVWLLLELYVFLLTVCIFFGLWIILGKIGQFMMFEIEEKCNFNFRSDLRDLDSILSGNNIFHPDTIFLLPYGL